MYDIVDKKYNVKLLDVRALMYNTVDEKCNVKLLDLRALMYNTVDEKCNVKITKMMYTCLDVHVLMEERR